MSVFSTTHILSQYPRWHHHRISRRRGITTNTIPMLPFIASLLHGQTSVCASLPTTSLSREFLDSVLSYKLRDDCLSSLPVVKEDRSSSSSSSQMESNLDLFPGDREHQFSSWSDLSYVLPSLEAQDHLPAAFMDEHVYSIAEESLSSSELTPPLAEDPDLVGHDIDQLPSSSLRDTAVVNQRTVRSSRLLERKSKKRRSSKPILIDKTGGPGTKSKKHSERVDSSDPLKLFNRNPEAKKILTAEKQNDIIKEIQDFNKLIDVKIKLQSQFNREPTFAEWGDAVGLSSRALQLEFLNWERRHGQLINSNVRLVAYIAKQYQGRGLSFESLMQAGCTGLLKALEKYKPHHGSRFPSYAYWWIRQHIRKAIFQYGRLIRLPENIHGLLRKIHAAKMSYIHEGIPYPTAEDLACKVGITVKRLQYVLSLSRDTISTEQSVHLDRDTKFREVIEDNSVERPETFAEKQFMRKHIRSVLGCLTPREQLIIKLRFGIGTGTRKQWTLVEIGNLCGLSKERVRQLEYSALQTLKQAVDIHGLKEYSNFLV